MRATTWIIVVGVVLGPASIVHAHHPIIDRAIALVDDADFDGALDAFHRAEAASDLDREDLIQIYARRAALRFAMGDDGSAREDLRRLVAIEPAFAFDASTPPSVVAALDEERAQARPIALDVDTTSVGDSTRLIATLRNDPGGLVRAVHLYVRAPGASAWTTVVASTYEAHATALDLYAEAVGPGGVVVARHASEAAPDHVGAPAPLAPVSVAAASSGSDETTWWIVGGVGAGVLVAGVVIIALVATSGPSDQTAFTAPVVRTP